MALSFSLKSSIFMSGLFQWPMRTSFILQPKPSIRLCAPKALRNAFWRNIKPLRGSRVSHQQAGWELLRALYQRQPFFPQVPPGCHSCPVILSNPPGLLISPQLQEFFTASEQQRHHLSEREGHQLPPYGPAGSGFRWPQRKFWFERCPEGPAWWRRTWWQRALQLQGGRWLGVCFSDPLAWDRLPTLPLRLWHLKLGP